MRSNYATEKTRLCAANNLVTAQMHLLRLIQQNDAAAGKAFDLVHEALLQLGLLPDQACGPSTAARVISLSFGPGGLGPKVGETTVKSLPRTTPSAAAHPPIGRRDFRP